MKRRAPIPLLQLLCALALSLFWAEAPCFAALIASAVPLERGFVPIPFVSPDNLKDFTISAAEEAPLIRDYCERAKKEFRRYQWQDDPCGSVPWKAELKTAKGFPLLYTSFGSGKDTTLFLGGVHPDELTPIHLAFRFARYLHDNPQVYQAQGLRVIIAPLVNPDGFFREKPIRTNGLVDLNRNFFTIDWYEMADAALHKNRVGYSRYFPGYFPNTELETLFQVRLLDQFQPTKIFSVHAPLGFLDYDGPDDLRPQHLAQVEKRSRRFVHEVAKKAQNYRVVDFAIYPGSLGNYAGNERNLATITLELETTIPQKVDQYWEKFLPGFLQSIHYPFKTERKSVNDNASHFFSSYYHQLSLERKNQG